MEHEPISHGNASDIVGHLKRDCFIGGFHHCTVMARRGVGEQRDSSFAVWAGYASEVATAIQSG